MSLADANKKYFDTIGDHYDKKPWFAQVNNKVTDFLRSKLEWLSIPIANTGSPSDAQHVRLLDYACGPGLMSRVYGPYVTVTRGIDISPNMVAIYNARARAANLPVSTIEATLGNIFSQSQEDQSPRLSEPEYQNFDLATVGFGFHHFEDVVHASRCLKERLRPGGVLVISDFLEGGDLQADENGNPIAGSEGDHTGHIHVHDHDDHGFPKPDQHRHHHHHHGHSQGEDNNEDKTSDPNVRKEMAASIVVPSFTIEGVKKFFTEAGFVDVDVILMDEKVYMEFAGRKVWRTVLFARGRKPFDEAEKEKSEL